MLKRSTYKNLYECDCENLTRTLPFRENFTEHVVKDIQKLFSKTKDELVYVAQGPGGLLFDYLLMNKLIDAGYSKITVIIIEELYQEHIGIIQACLDFKQWCTAINHKANITPYFYTSTKEYAQTCKTSPKLKGHVLMTVDPDDKKTMPDFDSLEFRKKFVNTTKKTMRTQASFYYLFFQTNQLNNYRHMLIGRLYQEEKLIVTYKQSYGEQSLTEQKTNRLFLETDEILLYEAIQDGIQVDGKATQSKRLTKLLHNPLK